MIYQKKIFGLAIHLLNLHHKQFGFECSTGNSATLLALIVFIHFTAKWRYQKTPFGAIGIGETCSRHRSAPVAKISSLSLSLRYWLIACPCCANSALYKNQKKYAHYGRMGIRETRLNHRHFCTEISQIPTFLNIYLTIKLLSSSCYCGQSSFC